MARGTFGRVKKPSGFTGKKPGDRRGSIFGGTDEPKPAKKPASPSAKSDKPAEKPAPKAAKKPAKKPGVLAVGISAEPAPEVGEENGGMMPETDAPDMPEMGMGGGAGMMGGMGGMDIPGVPSSVEAGGRDAVVKFLGEAMLEKLMRMQR